MNRRICLTLAISILLLASCGLPIRYTEVRGSGNLATESRRVAGIDAVELDGTGRLVIQQGDKESLEVTVDDNLMKYIRTGVKGRTLGLEIQEGVHLLPSDQITYLLTVKGLNRIEINGTGQVEADALAAGNLMVAINGDGTIDLKKVAADVMTTEISGMGDISATGEVHTLQIELSGSGKFNASELRSRMGVFDVSGSGAITAWVTDVLSIDISGSGDVGYYGSPVVNAEISGLGNVNALGQK